MAAWVKEDEYGIVQIVAGEYAGKVGYYDDSEEGRAIVYLGMPLVSRSILVRRRDLRHPTDEQKLLYEQRCVSRVSRRKRIPVSRA